jgi:hypothetical protein
LPLISTKLNRIANQCLAHLKLYPIRSISTPPLKSITTKYTLLLYQIKIKKTIPTLKIPSSDYIILILESPFSTTKFKLVYTTLKSNNNLESKKM